MSHENCKLSLAVTESLTDYFLHLDGEPSHPLYDMVLAAIEKPMLEFVLKHTGGNQSKTAEILGINRNTLRKKMTEYKLN